MDFMDFNIEELELSDIREDYQVLREIDFEYFHLTQETVAQLIEYMEDKQAIIFVPKTDGTYIVKTLGDIHETH